MLKAYDYIDATADRNTIQKSENFNKELKLAKKAVSRVLQMEQGNSPVCPGCAGRKLSVFFTQWGVDYLRCPDCGKVHAIFGESHADDIAKAHGISPVCRLPINPKLAAAVDAGMIELMDENGLDALADKLAGLLR